MAMDPDLSRIRQGAQQALAELDNLSQRHADCADDQLRSTLADIAQRKSGQAGRMLDWMRQRDDTVGSESPAVPEPAAAAPETQTHAGDAPATTAEGGEVIEVREVAPELIVFRVARPRDFQFVAGQSVKVGVGDVRRSFSIVSAPHEPFLEFFVELVPGGQMSGQLRELKVGDQVDLGVPKGGLELDASYPHHLMVATVTGINPFVSMLRDYLHSGRSGHHFHLMHGASYQNEHGYREELEGLAAAHPDILTYIPTVSRPDEAANQGWTGSSGRVNTLVDAYVADAGLTSSDTLAYACGHSGMLEAVSQQLKPKGFRLETESYD
ncbi:MAG: FAD-binding oxidoreductase [Marinobacter sp.]